MYICGCVCVSWHISSPQSESQTTLTSSLLSAASFSMSSSLSSWEPVSATEMGKERAGERGKERERARERDRKGEERGRRESRRHTLSEFLMWDQSCVCGTWDFPHSFSTHTHIPRSRRQIARQETDRQTGCSTVRQSKGSCVRQTGRQKGRLLDRQAGC